MLAQPALWNMPEKLSESVIRFEDVQPYNGIPKGEIAGYFRPQYYYVGSKKKAVKECNNFDFHLVMVPPGNSTSSIHYRPDADVFIVVLGGRCTFWDEAGEKVSLSQFDALLLRNHPYAYRNVGTELLWLGVVVAPPSEKPSVYKKYLIPQAARERR